MLNTMDTRAECYLLHREPMLLVDNVITCSASQITVSVVIGEKHRLFIQPNQCVAAWISIELMAQAVGVWAGVQGKQQGEAAPKIGFLLGGRQCKHFVDGYNVGDQLLIEADMLMQDQLMASFDARILDLDGKCLASARLTTYQPSETELAALLDQQ
ncbi:ApeP family dehydratase [Testudinibacter sp. TR-2022]|uniref:ApeP family dehydratase n=1 Tax=Testudinibacter sp. TR-2022 TaxID=2585029 RepID=UPI0011188EDF|nr:thioester dehydrase [Testudinibacter sp. TR-2022]TNH06010.1 thioester dehydrase [Pasteurellaceae bacterium Phil11]TNH24289.1 thioester dehydrase [Testudinibacter sp. TR-2022]TNH26880.1 thioester dehydrase [Testudinibacter sp. TR-2022]